MNEKNNGRPANRYIGGLKNVRATFKHNPKSIRRLLFAQHYHGAAIQEIKSLARLHAVRVQSVPRVTLDRLTKPGEHQGIVVDVSSFELHSEREFEQAFIGWQNPLILALDTVQDPRNLGACLRVADGAGVDAVLLGRNRCAPLTDVVYRTSTGVLDSLFLVQVANLVRTLRWLQDQNCWVVGTDDDEVVPYTAVDYRRPIAMVVGNEGKGLRRLTKEVCDHVVGIPMSGQATSLNVSVATGILLYEVCRQRASSAK